MRSPALSLLLSTFSLALFFTLGCKPASESHSAAAPGKEASAALPFSIEGALYVAPPPFGSDNAAGDKENPLATVQKAMEQLPPGKGGVILLREGVYTTKLELQSEEENPAPLIVAAAPGENVIFEGGSIIEKWEPFENEPKLFVVTTAPRETLWSAPPGTYFEIWDESERLRFRKTLDIHGTKAWPNSVCLLDDGRLLIHPEEGEALRERRLWVNRAATGANINRSNTTLHGLHFRNYLGGLAARAITVGRVKNATLRNCEVVNSTIGVLSSGQNTMIEECTFREVGNGIRHAGGKEMTVRNCFIESATGLFAFSDVSEHIRNGIRVYHPADGATVEGCITSGFWAGLYIKTVSGQTGSLPYVIHNNTFLDGIRSGADHRQPRSTYRQNIVGPAVGDGVLPNGEYLLKMGATLIDNFFYDDSKAAATASRTQQLPAAPFMNLQEGDLNLKPGTAQAPLGAPGRKVAWSKHHSPAISATVEVKEPGWITLPYATSAASGAIINGSLNVDAEVLLRYRRVGDEGWRTIRAKRNFLPPARDLRASAPFAQVPRSEFPFIVALTQGHLEQGAQYEFVAELAGAQRATLKAASGRFVTSGGPRTLYVAPGNPEANGGDGSQAHPYTDIQAALNCALPGDRLLLAGGTYTRPLLLNHGGNANAPIHIEGAGATETFLDGGREAGVMVTLHSAPHVSLAKLCVRQFGNAGIHVTASPHFTMAHVWITNGPLQSKAQGISGQGLWLEESPHSSVTHSLFTRVESGIVALRSPHARLLNNTAFGNLYSGISIIESCEGSIVEGNSLNFTGNQSLRIRESSPQSLDSFQCDYNNYGSLHRDNAPLNKQLRDEKLEEARPENDFQPARRYGAVSKAKQIIEATVAGNRRTFHRMEDWRSAFQRDLHSLYADPEFADPRKGDFRLLPHSPNILPGRTIGAF